MPDSGYLHVYSNDLRTPDALATQTGTAHYDGVVVDEFEQVHDMADILWAVDISCSMGDEQPNLMDNFASFIDIIELLGIDYHVAVINTQSSFFEGEIPIITSTTPDAHAAFADAVSMDLIGSHGQAMEMALQALTPPETNPGGPNHGFLRDYATLHIVFISDQDDFSPDTVSSYVTQLQSLKLNQDWVYLNGVTGQSEGCYSAVGNAGPSPRYEQAIDMTGGISTSLCAEDWIDTLFNSESISSPINTLELSQYPVKSTIEVEFNGVPTYAGWTYDAWLNSLVFEPGHVPNAGDLITITYNRLGSCY